jgi:hypothetical protein
MSLVTAHTILERLSKALHVNSDVELAASLGVAPQTISTWKKRNKVPFDHIVEISEKSAFSLDAIIFGDDWTKQNGEPGIKLAHAAKGMSEIYLAEDVLALLSEELPLEEEGLNKETLATIISAMGEVKKRLPGGLYLPKENSRELKEGIHSYLSSYYEIMHIARRNTKKKSSSNVTQNINGDKHTIAGNDITIKNKK